MSFRADRRGQSMQIGAMLLFGLLVVAAASYQVTVVPQQNADVEFTHGEAVRTDLLHVRNSVLRTALDGGVYPVTVELGTSYPPRTVFVNPPPATGTLSTTLPGGDGRIEVRYATVESGEDDLSRQETADFWTGSDAWSQPTTTLVYEPRYTTSDQPTTAYENSVLFHRYGDGSTVPATGQTLVQDRTVSLVVLSGELSITSADAVSLDPVAVSAGTRTVPITADGDENVEIALPTKLSTETWRGLLKEEFVDQGGYVDGVSVADGTLVIELRGSDDDGQVTYDLRLSNVGVGSNVGRTSAAYVTFVDEGDRIVPEGTRQAFTVEVRDVFDDPVSGVALSATIIEGGGAVSPTSAVTDDRGRASFIHEASDAGTGSVASVVFGDGFHGGENGPKEARFAVDVTDRDSSDGSDTTDVAFRVDDLTDRRSNDPSLVASYDLTTADRTFIDVEVSFTSEDGNPSRTVVGTLPRGSVRYEPGYGGDDEFDVVLRATYEDADGTRLVQSRAIVDRADGQTYAGANDDLTDTNEIVTFDVTDETDVGRNDPRYVVDYEVESADFGEVEIAALSLDAAGGSVRDVRSSPAGSGVELHPGDGAGSEYRLKLLVYDESGAVIETVSLTDVADGTGGTG
jgi:hypothetical protein